MGFGSYDDDEHAKREEKKNIDAGSQQKDDGHDGEVTMTGDTDVDSMLNKLKETKKTDS